jgi:hypothetical protein
MYKVVIRKSLRYADGSTAREESQEEVNHERHALNLASKIARSHDVESVEIEELRGRFKARADRSSDGEVHATLQSRRGRVQRETHYRNGRTNRAAKLLLISLLGLGALGYIASQVIRSPEKREIVATSGDRFVQIGDFRVSAIALLSPSTDLMRIYGLTPRNGYQPVTVNINVSNIGQATNCLEFDPLLIVRTGHKPLVPGTKALRGPKVYNLAPAENRDGSYTFEVKNGAEPVMLELVPKPTREYSCQFGNASRRRTPLINKVTISLEGLPKPWQK